MNNLQNIFLKAGLILNPGNFQRTGKSLELYFIKNPDGSIRWIWPEHTSKPLFLKFYNVSSVKAHLFSSIIRLIFIFKLQKVFFSKREVCFAPTPNATNIFPIESNWALFTGTPGPNRKAIIYTEENSQGSFVKIPYSSQARALIYSEGTALEQLSKSKSNTFKVPQVIRQDLDFLQIEDIAGNGHRTTKLTEAHIRALCELSNFSKSTMQLKDLRVWQEITDIIQDQSLNQDSRIPKGMLRKISRLVEGMDPDTIIDTSTAHGDFTPWNMFANNEKLHIYDWELSREKMPLGFDAFHFVIQQGILSDGKGWKEIREDIDATLLHERHPLFAATFHQPNFYLHLYLIINTVLYLDIYSRQKQWHLQIDWLLTTWNEALSEMANTNNNARSLVMSDAFDLLQSKDYAALKLSEEDPEKISEFSDIDLCLAKEDSLVFEAKITQHPLVLKSVVQRKSYMSNIQLVLRDGTVLSIDCIWKFKRKYLEYLNLKQVLSNVVVNRYGIKQASQVQEARYIGLFYGLNHAEVPEKYMHYRSALMNEKSPMDQAIHQYYQNPPNTHAALVGQVLKLTENKKFNRWKNWVDYLVDGLSSLIQKGGIVVTFSGVDGAGKSTVIDNVKLILEKKLRRKVVVIRHRPSIFPILSAWTKGKVKAEQDAANSLPRQGSNASKVSSLLRFGYYYTDYVLGQFIIVFKHVIRGQIVLYDRYYFDFINDSKRSNIQLPEKITRIGYKLLLKPDLNFFLYADPAVILARKQELASSTITELTQKYLELFASMNRKSSYSRYIPIENIQLEDTLQTIMNRLIQKAA